VATEFENFVNTELPRRSAFLYPAIVSGYDNDPNLVGAPDTLKNAPKGTWYYEETANKWWRKRSSASADWSDQTAGGGTGVVDQREEVFTPSLGQTVFNLSATPNPANDTSVFVNTVKYIYGVNFTVSGTQVTWLDSPFTLDSLDVVEIIYYV
jgi:hypothetical protein